MFGLLISHALRHGSTFTSLLHLSFETMQEAFLIMRQENFFRLSPLAEQPNCRFLHSPKVTLLLQLPVILFQHQSILWINKNSKSCFLPLCLTPFVGALTCKMLRKSETVSAVDMVIKKLLPTIIYVFTSYPSSHYFLWNSICPFECGSYLFHNVNVHLYLIF